jgi:hypothetical protein
MGLAHAGRRGRVTFVGSIQRELGLQPYIFADESGKWRDKAFICLCGYLSTDDDWTAFVARWRVLLAKYEFPALHLTTYWQECKARQWSPEKTDVVLSEFIDVVREHTWLAVAVGMDTGHFKAMPSHAQRALGDPDMLCMERFLRLIRNRLAAEDYNGRISVTFDEDEEYVVKSYRIIRRLRCANPDLGRYIGAVSFADDTFLLPLQAADMLANLTSRFYRVRLLDKDAPVPPLLERL